MNEKKYIFLESLWYNNASLSQLLGLCPLLAVSNTVINALGLGIATTLVLICTNIAVSALRSRIPSEICIPIYVMIIASIVSIVQMLINAYIFDFYKTFGVFIPLIVTNCIIISRTKSYALQQPPVLAAIDGLATGLGSICTLLILGSLREILSEGTLFDGANKVLGEWAKVLRIEIFHTDTHFLLATLPPGVFIILGFMVAGKYFINQYIKDKIAKVL